MTVVVAASLWRQTCCCPDTVTRVRTMLKRCRCSAVGSPVLRYSVNYHEQTQNIYFDKTDEIVKKKKKTKIKKLSKKKNRKIYTKKKKESLQMVQLWWGSSPRMMRVTKGKRWPSWPCGAWKPTSCWMLARLRGLFSTTREATTTSRPLTIGGAAMERVKSTKFLGVHNSEDLSWTTSHHDHILQRKGTIEIILFSCITG